MTREEAIKILEPGVRFPDFPHTADDVEEACRIAVTSLRTQQTRAKLDRSRWEGCEHCNAEWRTKDFSPGEYFAHDFRIYGDSILFNDSKFGWEGVLIKFCPFCGRPLNEEAWAELERRINGGTDDV